MDGGKTFTSPLYGINGMTLRDVFAAAALAGLYACPEMSDSNTAEELAVCAFRAADAMMQYRISGCRCYDGVSDE